jgi:mono/diheme cytochrome c family protein
MKPILFAIGKAVGVLIVLAAISLAIYVKVQTSRFDASMAKIYDLPLPDIARSTDPVVLARGKHLVASIGGCSSNGCHGADLGGGAPIDVGPVGVFTGPNISMGGLGLVYTDGELARVIKHGVKKDGRGVRLMPVSDFGWLPDADIAAMVSYIRTTPPVDRANGATEVKALGKILDRRGEFPLDQARHVAEMSVSTPPTPAPTPEYGAFVARACMGCHGEGLSGGPLPGAPPSIPIPLNLTPDATGLKDWTFEDFDKVMKTAVRKNGKILNPFMPVESWKNFDDVEMHALWGYLRSIPAAPFGNR